MEEEINMGDLAFHTFLILFFCGLIGMVLGWYCRSILANFNAPTRQPEVKNKPSKRTKSRAKKISVKKPSDKPKTKAKTKPIKRDNLKLISGVGPVLEKKLNKQGVKTFAQIAVWKKADIDKFDEVLDFKGRITREGWVKQAKQLIKKNL